MYASGEKGHLLVSPNPVQQVLNINLVLGNEKERIECILLDLHGRRFKTWEMSGIPTYQLDMAALPAGIYFLHVALDGRVFQRKKIIKNFFTLWIVPISVE